LIRNSLIAGALLLAGAAPAFAADAPDGGALFADNCAACHQPKGEGVGGAFPALAGNSFVQGPPEQPVGVLLDGRGGMPSFRDDLTDEQIAAILSYVRSNWGNSAPAVPPSLVAGVRGGEKQAAAGPLQAH
jgi:mono/diheme cytochrome c family protein